MKPSSVILYSSIEGTPSSALRFLVLAEAQGLILRRQRSTVEVPKTVVSERLVVLPTSERMVQRMLISQIGSYRLGRDGRRCGKLRTY